METVDNTKTKNTIFELIKNCEFDRAEVLENENSISEMEIGNIASKAFNLFVSQEKYVEAVQIAERYNLPSEKKTEAVSGQFRLFNKNKKYDNNGLVVPRCSDRDKGRTARHPSFEGQGRHVRVGSHPLDHHRSTTRQNHEGHARRDELRNGDGHAP